MSTIETGGAVFPLYDHHSNGQRFLAETGMSLRDYFAAKAMQSLLMTIDEFPDEHWRTGVAMDAYMMADAMLKAPQRRARRMEMNDEFKKWFAARDGALQARNCILDISIDGYRTYPAGLACNAPAFLAPDLGQELANKSGTFGLVWSMAGDGQILCSLSSNGNYDVSVIAKALGGGGHRNAAGFSTDISTLLSWLK